MADLPVKGWNVVEWPVTHRLMDLAETIVGHRVRIAHGLKSQLVAADREQARPGSKSARRGRGEFPPHTDGAHLHTPPHYILLRALSQKTLTSTYLVNFSVLHLPAGLLDGLKNGIWTTGNRGRTFLCSVVSERPFVRWDEDCMRPSDRIAHGAHEFLRGLLVRAPQVEHKWNNPNCVLILDNWHVLHGRGQVSGTDHRVLERVALED